MSRVQFECDSTIWGGFLGAWNVMAQSYVAYIYVYPWAFWGLPFYALCGKIQRRWIPIQLVIVTSGSSPAKTFDRA